MTIGEVIRHYRLKGRMTQAQLAEKIGVTVAAISKWETGAGMPDISMIVPLARMFGTTTDEILRLGERREEFEMRWKQTLRENVNDSEKLLQVALDTLKEFPWDRTSLLRAALEEKQLGEMEQDSKCALEYFRRGAAHARLLVDLEPENEGAKRLRDEFREYIDSANIGSMN